MAVYTDVNDTELKAFITTYGLGDLVSYKGIAEGVENTNYFVVTTRGRYILTLYEQRVKTDDLPFFLGLLDHLAASGIDCPTPIKTADGQQVTELSGKAAAIVSFLEGFCIQAPEAHHCRDVGRTLARLHIAGRSYTRQRPNALGLAGWRPLFQIFSSDADKIVSGLSSSISNELDWLHKNWPQDLETGIIHADLFPDNVFFLGDKLSGLIDFYFACNDIFALDIAICINAWCFDRAHNFRQSHAAALLEGYQSERQLSQSECAALPILCRGAAMRFLLTRSFDWLNTKQNALVRPHDPRDYLKRLAFHQQVATPDTYGIHANT